MKKDVLRKIFLDYENSIKDDYFSLKSFFVNIGISIRSSVAPNTIKEPDLYSLLRFSPIFSFHEEGSLGFNKIFLNWDTINLFNGDEISFYHNNKEFKRIRIDNLHVFIDEIMNEKTNNDEETVFVFKIKLIKSGEERQKAEKVFFEDKKPLVNSWQIKIQEQMISFFDEFKSFKKLNKPDDYYFLLQKRLQYFNIKNTTDSEKNKIIPNDFGIKDLPLLYIFLYKIQKLTDNFEDDMVFCEKYFKEKKQNLKNLLEEIKKAP